MRPAVVIVAVALLVGLPSAGAAPGRPPAESGWDQQSAARYLDDRMEAWLVAKKRRLGNDETTCVSCHTTVAYVIARPPLRQAMHVNEPTPQEARVRLDVTRRVATYATHRPYYELDERKKVESRGTEAVLNALILATADEERHRATLSEPTRAAFEHLWTTQRADGAWDWLDFGLEPFESAGAAYYGATLAALAIGAARAVSPGPTPDATAGIDRLRRYVTEQYAAQSLHHRAWVLLASSRWKDLLTDRQRDALLAEIQRVQRDDGGWSLRALGPWRWSRSAWRARPPGAVDDALLAQSDGYATGLMTYTLRMAGLAIDHPAVTRGLQWLRTHQHDVQTESKTYRAWRTYSLNYDREHGGDTGEPLRRMFMSDAATAVAVLALTAPDRGAQQP
jgi:squalene-hopene/tetraprenyl-beta-curcumene cyclase